MVPPADEVMNRVMIIMARLITCLTQRGDSIGGDQQALHPLLAWWAILFALSMLARYQPDTWTDYLDVDRAPPCRWRRFLIEPFYMPGALAPCHPIRKQIRLSLVSCVKKLAGQTAGQSRKRIGYRASDRDRLRLPVGPWAPRS